MISISLQPKGPAFGALLDAKFEIPDEMRNFCTNAKKTKQYDQIAFRVQDDRLGSTGKAGVFDFFQYVFKEADESLYEDAMGSAYKRKSNGKTRTEKERSSYYNTYWKTHQMSDHLPLWVELKIDFSEEYLTRKKVGEVSATDVVK